MKLDDALQETGCAFFTFGDCTTSVERLPDGMFLLMTRRGVSILLCLMVRWDYLMRRYEYQTWHPGQVQIVRFMTTSELMGSVTAVVPKIDVC